MFTNIVVGVDGGPGGRDACLLARRLADPGAIVTLVHVYGSAGSAAVLRYLPDAPRAGARRLVEAEREDTWPEAAAAAVCALSTGRGLHEFAARSSADLIVVGSSSLGIVGKVLLGDDTRAALNGAPCALAIAPWGFARTGAGLNAIGVGFDAEPEAARALEAARELARRLPAALQVTRVVTRQDVRRLAPMPAEFSDAAEALVGHAQARLDTLDGVAGRAVYGDPREELAKLSLRVDLLVVGSRGYGPLGSVFHGSVAGYLERHAASALLVLPRDLPAPAPLPETIAGGVRRGRRPAAR